MGAVSIEILLIRFYHFGRPAQHVLKEKWNFLAHPATLMAVKHLLCNMSIFAGLDDQALGIFLEHAKRMEVPAGAVIAREGEANNCMYLIETGEVCIVKGDDTPHPVTLAALGPGDFFGEMCILESQPRSATGKAASPATIVSVSSSAFYHLYQKMPKQHSVLLLNIARDLSRRLRHLDEVFAARH
jgi:CRP/FNR family transcriptional regulator, cyclic AMP receptor protein